MRVVVARVGRAVGIRGDVSLEVRTDEPERRLVPGARLFVAGTGRVLTVESVHQHGNRLRMHVAGIDDRSAAEELTGAILEVERDAGERPEDPEEFYDDTLLGLPVVTEDGQAVGTVSQVVHLPAQDLLAVRAHPEAPEVLIPFVAAIVPVVDLEGGRIVIRPPAGLLDEPAESTAPESTAPESTAP